MRRKRAHADDDINPAVKRKGKMITKAKKKNAGANARTTTKKRKARDQRPTPKAVLAKQLAEVNAYRERRGLKPLREHPRQAAA